MVRILQIVSLALAFLGIGSAAFAGPPANAEPKAIVDWIYAESIKSQKTTEDSFSILNDDIMPALFSKPFLAAYKRADAIATKKEEPLIDADPVSNSQDPQISAVVTKVVSQTDKAATVSANFKSSGMPERVVYRFVKEGADWKLDDMVIGAKESYSLLKFLKAVK